MAYNLLKSESDNIKTDPKCVRFFLRNKKTPADLNFLAIDLQIYYIVNSFMTYNLWKFEVDSIKIEA